MTGKPLEIEGIWEEIVSHSDALAGCQVRVTVLSRPPQSPSPDNSAPFRPAGDRSLLRHAGTWSGDDLEDCLNMVYETRQPLEF
ncbi:MULTISPECIES: hypothetical protein [Limnospira]|uniref:Uncharacterized protein n=4 Tax=Limnospira TaxID=2596745 RepID=A0A9P1KL48_9CYAN|nr:MULTISPECIES: hypothetical protein [Limnospira]RAQ39226.1 hypothetical protein B9S53_22945 [Arthrospira sp. O9.13F]EDZ94414.1 conserved hypothetical protein [Limnospira maxima CS-328]MDT9190969.1 hypothetical protein [Limnospira sp. PMC 894.15]MDT9236904.1 hypothetical protein [Limnospira sp. PMC 917.15]QNH57672.1 MAG: hypothetical protein H2674_27000 [Limnospira indica BM01]